MSSESWKKENTVRYHLRISRKTGIPEALELMLAKTGEAESSYIKRAITAALIEDGYLAKEAKITKAFNERRKPCVELGEG